MCICDSTHRTLLNIKAKIIYFVFALILIVLIANGMNTDYSESLSEYNLIVNFFPNSDIFDLISSLQYSYSELNLFGGMQ